MSARASAWSASSCTLPAAPPPLAAAASLAAGSAPTALPAASASAEEMEEMEEAEPARARVGEPESGGRPSTSRTTGSARA